MGNPEHYSMDLPARCLRLLDELQPVVSETFMPGQDEELGPLTATFSLTMAIPIITLPYERIYKQTNEGFHYADDRQLREGLEGAVRDQMSLPKLSKSVFYHQRAWSFVRVGKDNLFNIADGLPGDVAVALSEEPAFARADDMPVPQWISCLRNAIAHGGVVYLDRYGSSSYGQSIQMYGFVSGKYDRSGESPVLEGLNILRVGQSDFVKFLHHWVSWLQQSRLRFEPAA